MSYRCSVCDFEVEEIPEFEEGECPFEIQHYFEEMKNEIVEKLKKELRIAELVNKVKKEQKKIEEKWIKTN